jgi:hypothetical protein
LRCAYIMNKSHYLWSSRHSAGSVMFGDQNAMVIVGCIWSIKWFALAFPCYSYVVSDLIHL